jgi:hypothetical protein
MAQDPVGERDIAARDVENILQTLPEFFARKLRIVSPEDPKIREYISPEWRAPSRHTRILYHQDTPTRWVPLEIRFVDQGDLFFKGVEFEDSADMVRWLMYEQVSFLVLRRDPANLSPSRGLVLSWTDPYIRDPDMWRRGSYNPRDIPNWSRFDNRHYTKDNLIGLPLKGQPWLGVGDEGSPVYDFATQLYDLTTKVEV